MRRTSYVADYSAQHFSGYRKPTMVVSVASTTTDGEEDRSTGVLIAPPSAFVRSRAVPSTMPNGSSASELVAKRSTWDTSSFPLGYGLKWPLVCFPALFRVGKKKSYL